MQKEIPAGFKSSSLQIKNYLSEVATYLDERGLSVKDFDLVLNFTKNHNTYHKVDGQMTPLTLEGWAFRVKDHHGEYLEGGLLFRPCNWPDGLVYTKTDDGDYEPYSKPKFIQVGGWRIHWTSSAQEIMNAPHVMLHEKFTCAQLAVKHLGYPSIGMSGCGNWSHKRTMIPELRRALTHMLPNTTLYVCLDGDIESNPDVNAAARGLLGWVKALRDDVRVVFPRVPAGFGGWDDWLAVQDYPQDAWVLELAKQGIDITPHLPAELLVSHYGLGAKVDKAGRIAILHTASNYTKLLTQHPRWRDFVVNTNQQLYELDRPSRSLETDAVARRLETWLTDEVFAGADAESVSYSAATRAAKEFAEQEAKQVSLAHHHIELLGPPVELDEARAAVRRLFTEGLRVIGPMTPEELETTMLRVFRDMVGMWGWDNKWSPQWMLCLVGASGSGKSDFPRSLLRPLIDRGFMTAVGRLYTSGDKSKPEEMARIVNSSMVAVVDEYNPPSNLGQAKQFEDLLLSITSERYSSLRRMRENDPKPTLRTASVILTTTDKNRRFLRSGKGEGAERRAIVLETVGHYDFGGTLTSDREVIEQCGNVLLRWGLHAYKTGCFPGSATEFSVKYSADYLDEDEALRNVSKVWARGGFEDELRRVGQALVRKSGGWRISASMLLEVIYPGQSNVPRETATKIRNLAVECGAKEIGKARCNGLDGVDKIRDRVLEIKDWGEWSDHVRVNLGV